MPLASTAAISRSSGRSFFSLLDKSWGVIYARLAGFGGSPHLLSAQTKTEPKHAQHRPATSFRVGAAAATAEERFCPVKRLCTAQLPGMETRIVVLRCVFRGKDVGSLSGVACRCVPSVLPVPAGLLQEGLCSRHTYCMHKMNVFRTLRYYCGATSASSPPVRRMLCSLPLSSSSVLKP